MKIKSFLSVLVLPTFVGSCEQRAPTVPDDNVAVPADGLLFKKPNAYRRLAVVLLLLSTTTFGGASSGCVGDDGLFGPPPPQSSCKPAGKVCNDNSDCCSGYCDPGPSFVGYCS
jgi:hypothetical protein